MTILEYLQEKSLSIAAECGGNGTCGKCLVKIKGRPGVFRACRTEYEQGMQISVVSKDEKMEAVTVQPSNFCKVLSPAAAVSEPAGIAIDIGTTTVAAAMADIHSGNVIAEMTAMNSCRKYGSDVISRIQAAAEGKSEDMRTLLRHDIAGLVNGLIISADRKAERIVISGNTAMIHTLMGYDMSGLGKYPYNTFSTDAVEDTYGNIVGGSQKFLENVKVYIIPGISAFVGGDIVSGLYHIAGKDIDTGCFLFLDLGTNGEMAVADSGHLLVSSAAAGPAFEGGHLSSGTGSIPGAISHVLIKDRSDVKVHTVNDMPPTGICGSGVIETVSELLKKGFLERDGHMADSMNGSFVLARRRDGSLITFTQKDVREVQLAKAAVRAGLEMLMKYAGISENDISKFYIAGGFGFNIDSSAAADIGLIPEKLRFKVESVGNASLLGALDVLCDENSHPDLYGIVGRAVNTDLADDGCFQQEYFKYMDF